MWAPQVWRNVNETPPPPPFHINMQRRLTGTIPVVCAGFQKGPRRAEKVQVPDVGGCVCVCVEGTPQTRTGGHREGAAYTIQELQDCAQHTLQIALVMIHAEAQGSKVTRDRDDAVTLYLHIYENALFCSLIWLIAGRNWGRWGLLRLKQNQNIWHIPILNWGRATTMIQWVLWRSLQDMHTDLQYNTVHFCCQTGSYKAL